MDRNLWETQKSCCGLGELLCVGRCEGSYDSLRRVYAKTDASTDMCTMEDLEEPIPESEAKRGQ